MKNTLFVILAMSCLMSAVTFVVGADRAANDTDRELAADLELLQGSWELLHGNEGKGEPNTRSVKTIEGNTETLRRYSIKTGKLHREHSVDFKLSKSGNVHVLTFFIAGGSPEQGLSYVYKVDKDNFYDVPGLLHGDEYRNYQSQTRVWHWKRVPDNDPDANAPSPSRKAAGPVICPTPQDMGRQFVAGLSSGGPSDVERLYVSRADLESTFAGEGLEKLHAGMMKRFRDSVTQLTTALAGAKYVRMNMEYCPEPIAAKEGTDFGHASFKRDTQALDNIRVIVNAGGEEREIKLDALVKVGDSWRLISPDVKLLPRR